ncbi:hypothetical protein B0T16DRAFT_327280 [Cercophora newfieldiana]|uniref:Rhodopsin domain-containing protein n=1 Tax=Cercophora newfieldiana TaxID=92897 RepID=A0AA40CTC4_9PEZI|nr:hypothetical protein B0T16DRAFT_327280 [Cercophora newfieldiana]
MASQGGGSATGGADSSGAGAGAGSGPSDPTLIPGYYEDLGYQIDVVVWTLTAVSGIVVSLRLWAKWSRMRALWWDDNLLGICWVFLVVCAIIGSYNRTLGFGKHIFAVNPANYAAIDLNSNISCIFSILGATWSKTSFALTMLRLNQGWKTRTFLWFIIVTMNLAMYATIILTWLKCVPGGRPDCVALPFYNDYSTFSGSYSAAVDITLAMMPWPLIWGLQMKKKEKLGIALAMSLGVFAGVTAIMKTVAIPGMTKGDFTYDGAQLVIWGNAEVATTIMAASIPVLRVLFINAKGSAERYYDSGRRGTGRLPSNPSKNNTIITSNRKNGGYATEGTGDDDGSDRSILDTTSPGNGRIIQTNEVTLEYSERPYIRRDDRDGWYQMDKMDGKVGNAV